jgi:formate hydrogenlyase subunit 6/NADH:ubiquinone oxidoreductase subunit I
MALLTPHERRHFPDWDDPGQCIYHPVTVDLDRCDGCKLCAVACPANALEQFGAKGHKKVRVRADMRGCISCNNCRAICENGAIEATQYYDFVGYYRQLGRGEFTMPRKF